jgi:hypothetical protein
MKTTILIASTLALSDGFENGIPNAHLFCSDPSIQKRNRRIIASFLQGEKVNPSFRTLNLQI